MSTETEKNIKVIPNGPYQVKGNIPLNQLRIVSGHKGAATSYKLIQDYKIDETYYLCRCGKTKNKPFCDGSHLEGFDGTETAGHKTYDEMSEKQEGEILDLLDAEELCAVARFCDTYKTTWNMVNKHMTEKDAEIVKQQCADCPSGRLIAVTKEGKRLEPELPQEISILEDTFTQVHGPIWVKGGIPIVDEAGKTYPIRNRVTLCRCGLSKNKPFCDGMHMKNKGELRD